MRKIPAEISHVVFCLTIHNTEEKQQNFNMLDWVHLRLIDQETLEEIAHFRCEQELDTTSFANNNNESSTRLVLDRIFQATSYAAYSGIHWAILTNLTEWQFYKVSTIDKVWLKKVCLRAETLIGAILNDEVISKIRTIIVKETGGQITNDEIKRAIETDVLKI